jgi:hypothetical protein
MKHWFINDQDVVPRGYEISKDELKVAESEITQICKL